MLTTRVRIGMLAALIAVAGCGSGDDDDGGGKGKSAKGAGACVERWNNEATKDVKAQASLSHRGDTGVADIRVGTYTGKAFSSTGSYYDDTGSSSSAEVSVTPGDCVALDLTSNDSETNWVMVLSKAEGEARPAWYFLDATGTHPLAKPPQKLGEQQTVGIVGLGMEAKLSTDVGD